MGLTFLQVSENHKKLWEAMANNTNVILEDALSDYKERIYYGIFNHRVVNYCFLCHYSQLNCTKCPGTKNNNDDCLNGLYRLATIFFKLRRWMAFKNIALEIANLPLTDYYQEKT
jgi:hypothetical protein